MGYELIPDAAVRRSVQTIEHDRNAYIMLVKFYSLIRFESSGGIHTSGGFSRVDDFACKYANRMHADCGVNSRVDQSVQTPLQAVLWNRRESKRRSFMPGQTDQDSPAVRQPDVQDIGKFTPIACQEAFHENAVTAFQRISIPALALEHVRAAQFQFPILQSAGFRFNIDVEVRVGIGPLHSGHDSVNFDPSGGIIFRGERMMRPERGRAGDQGESRGYNDGKRLCETAGGFDRSLKHLPLI
jgi:hypothetical protein